MGTIKGPIAKRKYSDTILAAVIGRISSEQDRINGIREKNRSLSVIIVGAVIGYSATSIGKPIGTTIPVILGIASTIIVAVFALQDRILHGYRHGWLESDIRTRKYIWGKLGDNEFKPLEYLKSDESGAGFFSKSTGWLYVVLFIGSLGSIFFPFIK